ncbi:hypothetical protein [Streptomyces camelliae]|uniref:Uncharacterized protein n=1 Tax=Streptomyces camelliae TaxID=3004093 RepID=A0ABY7NTC7_9ACTN|nr:hypothetical protein [Streptomyces sp. HUAS 2-6]WBO61491.1 hypothetical protein O1G22_00650 [Streptomyces sp. HUAS 2-6]
MDCGRLLEVGDDVGRVAIACLGEPGGQPRRCHPGADREHVERAFRVPGYPVVPVLSVVACGYPLYELPLDTCLLFGGGWRWSSTCSTAAATRGWRRPMARGLG